MIYALIVVYNKSCRNSNSITDIRQYAPDINLIVYDNSTKDFGNDKFCKENNIIYFTQNKNVGISKAYNFVINKFKFKKNDYLIMLDDDTHLTLGYLNEAKELAYSHQYDVNLPIVKANKKIISPYNYYMNCRTKMIQDPTEIVISKASGINSGMVINTNVFQKIHYNEKLFLDYVDYDFMRRVHKIQGTIHVMHSVINQEFQYFNYDKKNINGALTRFKFDMHDYKILCKETNENWFFYIHAIKFMLKQTIHYHSYSFLTLLLKFCFKEKKC